MTDAATGHAKAWVSAILARARPLGPIPRYGSTEWAALQPGDARFVAAVAIAAHAWFEDNGTDAAIAARLREEIAAGRQGQEQLLAEDFVLTAAGIRRDANKVSYAVLADRRGEHDRARRARTRAQLMRDHWNDANTGGAA
jgi:hypothetical protein